MIRRDVPGSSVAHLLLGKRLQELFDIPFAAAATGQRARPLGNGFEVHALRKQSLDIAARGAAAIAHHFVRGLDVLRVHRGWGNQWVKPYCNVHGKRWMSRDESSARPIRGIGPDFHRFFRFALGALGI